MFIQLLLALLAGTFFGTITGLTPGIHVNLISLILINLSGYLLGFTTPLALAVFIISMAITHTFLDSIPSIFLGAPDPDMALSILPGHKMLLEGKGFEAVKLTVIGSFFSLLLTLLFIPLMIPIIPIITPFLQKHIALILIIIIVYTILLEKQIHKMALYLFLFLVSGILGLIVFSWPNLEQPLFPLLSGLFGTSALLLSLNQETSLPKQQITNTIHIPFKEKAKALLSSVFCGSLTGLLPGIGSAQAAVIASQLVGKIGTHAFLILIGGVNTANFLFSIATFYTLQKARNGAIVAVMEILDSITIKEVILFIIIALIVGGIATILALTIAKLFARLITKVNYKHLCISIIALITILVFFFSGFYGLLILITATALGILPPLLNVKRISIMGCLLLPVILYFIL